MRDDGDLYLRSFYGRNRQTDAFDGDRSLLDHVLRQLAWNGQCEPIIFAAVDLRQPGKLANAVHMSLHHVSAEAALTSRRHCELEVHGGSSLYARKRRARQRLRREVCTEPSLLDRERGQAHSAH